MKPEKCIVVDGACEGNPGPGEYRALNTETGATLFHFGFAATTNNIMEFCGVVNALKFKKDNGLTLPIYSDSQTAIAWVKNKHCKTTLEQNADTKIMHEFICRCINWLKENDHEQPLKWMTKQWGEIPADFGRKIKY